MNAKQRNILRVYESASAATLRQGLEWYASAHEEAKRLADLLPLALYSPAERLAMAAGVISALSPGLKWELTIRAAESVIRGESLDGIGVRYAAHKNKAIRIAKGSNPSEEFDGRDRPKTRAFWKLIVDPRDTINVCIDVHAYSVWSGKRFTSDEVPHLRGELYKRIAGDYVELSRDLGILPNQLQAVTWTEWRRQLEIAPF